METANAQQEMQQEYQEIEQQFTETNLESNKPTVESLDDPQQLTERNQVIISASATNEIELKPSSGSKAEIVYEGCMDDDNGDT